MKKSHKSMIVILAIIIGVILYIYPRTFKHTYENGNKVKKIDVKLDGKVYKDRFVWQRLKFSEVLYGKVIIENKEYYLFPIDLYEFPDEDGNHTDNDIYSSMLSANKNDGGKYEYYFDVTHDKSKLYISSTSFKITNPSSNTATYSKEFVYPVESDEDYQNIKNRMKP
jgi:hypothetical protein